MPSLVQEPAASMRSTIGAACGLAHARICFPGDPNGRCLCHPWRTWSPSENMRARFDRLTTNGVKPFALTLTKGKGQGYRTGS
jgi:hypothetical protein